MIIVLISAAFFIFLAAKIRLFEMKRSRLCFRGFVFAAEQISQSWETIVCSAASTCFLTTARKTVQMSCLKTHLDVKIRALLWSFLLFIIQCWWSRDQPSAFFKSKNTNGVRRNEKRENCWFFSSLLISTRVQTAAATRTFSTCCKSSRIRIVSSAASLLWASLPLKSAFSLQTLKNLRAV